MATLFSCNHFYHDYCVKKGYAKIPFCDHCIDETAYKGSNYLLIIVVIEKLLK
jgi:hypothetical protein